MLVAQRSGHRFPRAPLIGMWALVAVALLATAAVRLTGKGNSEPASRPALTMDLHFEDMEDGGVAIYDAASHRLLDVVAPGTNGFMRATLRGLARERKRQGVGKQQAFRLTGWVDGRVTLDDSTTGRHVDLGSFGATNAQAFARLLTLEKASR